MYPFVILSAKRPWCITAATLEKIGFLDFLIAVSSEDECLDEYIEKWGEDRVVTYSYSDSMSSTDMLDNFTEGVGGAAPARNGCMDTMFSEYGVDAFWMVDDDFTSFTMPKDNSLSRKRVSTLEDFTRLIESVENFSDMSMIPVIGGACDMQRFPPPKDSVNPYVRGMYLIRKSCPIKFKGRMEEDLAFSYEMWRMGSPILALRLLGFSTKGVAEDEGGCTDSYKRYGTIRRAAYNVLTCPHTSVKVDKFGYSGFPKWSKVVPKIINGGYRRV